MNTENNLPLVYVFQGRFDPYEAVIGFVEPVKFSYFYQHFQQGGNDAPALMRTNELGILQPVLSPTQSEQKTLGKNLIPSDIGLNIAALSEIASTGITLSKLPQGMVSYLAAMEKPDFTAELQSTMNAVVQDSAWANFKLRLQKIPTDKLKLPTQAESDKDYKKWYDNLINEKVKFIYGFIVPKIRAIIFVSSLPYSAINRVSINIPGKTSNANIRVPEGRDIGKLSTFSYEGSEENVPKGVYKITVELTTAEIKSAGAWTNPIKNTDGPATYSLKEMARFDIKNDLGEFSLILIDPISVEETLVGQFPKEFSYILKLAKQNQDDGNVGEPASPSKGVSEVIFRWSTAKMAAEYAHTTATFPLNAKGALLATAGFPKAIMTAMGLPEDHIAQKFAATVEASTGAGKALSSLITLSENAPSQMKVTKEGAQKYFASIFASNAKALRGDEKKDFYDQVAGRITSRLVENKSSSLRTERLTKVFSILERLEKANKVVGTVTSLADFVGKGSDYMLNKKPELNSAKQDIAHVAADYHYLTQLEEIQVKPVIFGVEFEFNKANIDSRYFTNLNAIALQIIAVINAYEALPKAEQAIPLCFVIAGHSCDLGTKEYNAKLSQARADAVTHYLADQGIAKSYLKALGYGETEPAVANTNEANRKINRRVELNYSAFDVLNAAPSREGIQSLERYRTASVLKWMDLDKAEAEIIQAGLTLATGALMFTPAAPVVALGLAAYEVINAGIGVAKSVSGLVDTVFLDGVLAQLALDEKQLLDMVRQSMANMDLLDDFTAPQEPQRAFIKPLLDQYRVRSEAVNGLLYLLVLVGLKSNDQTSYSQLINDYQIQAYIENYILNDGWIYRPRPSFIMRLQPDFTMTTGQFLPEEKYHCASQRCLSPAKLIDIGAQKQSYSLGYYWAHVTTVTKNEPSSLAYWGLQNDYRFLSLDEQDKKVTTELNYGTRLPIPSSDQPHGYVRTDFNKLFPVHQLSSPKLEEFAAQFRANWGDLSKSDYAFIGVFRLRLIHAGDNEPSPLAPQQNSSAANAKPQDWFNITFAEMFSRYGAEATKKNEIVNAYWEPVEANPFKLKHERRSLIKQWHDQQRVYHDTPICIVVILKQHIDNHVPVSAQVIREDVGFADWGSINGPTYESVTRLCTPADFAAFPSLKDRTDLWQGKMGCLITPFYQHGKRRIDGLKPMATSTAMALSETFGGTEKKAVNYFALGHLNNMDYRIKVSLANVKRTEVVASLWGEVDGDYKKLTKLPQTIYTTVKLTQAPEQSALLNREFLQSTTDKAEATTLFANGFALTPFVRVANDAGVWSPMLNQYSHTTLINEASRQLAGQPQFKHSTEELSLNHFVWKNRCEFIFTLSCIDLDKVSYEERGLNWRSVACSVKLLDEIRFDQQGPQLSSSLNYLGELHYENQRYSLKSDVLADIELLELLIPYVDKQGDSRYTFKENYDAERIFRLGPKTNTTLRHVYMARFVPKYDSPKGLEIYGLRPFGSRPWIDRYLEYRFTAFAANGLKTNLEVFLEPMHFRFSQPASYTSGVPWSQGNPELAQNYPEDATEHQFLKSNEINEDELDYWMNEQAQVVALSALSPQAMRR